MYKKIILVVLFLLWLPSSYPLEKEMTKYQIVEAAAKALTADGFDLYGVEIIYDENNRMWRERVNKMTDLVNLPNFKLFERGFMKNYRAVLFNFKNPPGEVWVFVDKDTAEVFEIYRPDFKVESGK